MSLALSRSGRGGRRCRCRCSGDLLALGRQILVDALQPRLEERLEIDTAGWLDAGPIERGVRDVYRGRLTVHVRVLVVHHHVAQVHDLPGLVQRSFVGTDRHVHHVFGARRAAGL